MFKQKDQKGRKLQDVYVAVVQSGDLKSLQNLLDDKRKINAPIGRFGLTPLHLCAIFGQVEIAIWLLENKAKIDKKESASGKTPLHLAARFGHVDLLDIILEQSKELPNSKRFLEDTAKCRPIHYGCMQEDQRVVELLLKHGDQPNAFASIGTPLDIAIYKKNLPLADFLSLDHVYILLVFSSIQNGN
ncbi:MAG: ankyrin repeat domain-containing protein [Candidatus Neptunochlamydia sp.]|nr:ankyrin repeat domain-containing protein [Candidatus Neptunochlamydia sp.]